MLDIALPEPIEGNPSKQLEIPIVKAGDSVMIETSALPDHVYDEALYLGLKALCNRGLSAVTGTNYPDEQERKEVAAEIARKTVEEIYTGKIRRSSGAKTASSGKGELMVEARRLAKIYVKAELKEAGLRVSLIKPAEITKLANEMIANDQTIMEEAKENISKRNAKGKGKKIDVAALKAKIKEDPDLVARANAKGSKRRKPQVDEAVDVEVPHTPRPAVGRRLSQ